MINFDRPIAYHREFVNFGGVKAAVFLSQSFYWHYRTKDVAGWFYKSREEWEEETGLTRKEQETARKSLKTYGILQEKLEGLPRRLYYKIDVVTLEEMLTNLYGPKFPASRAESYQLEGTKGTSIIKETETTTENTTENKDSIPFSAIINFLNNETGKRYKSSSEKTKSLIRARWAEGFREPDFHEVIQKKNKEWAGTEWEQYLRPATIFGPKFEGYLNQQSTGTVEIGSLSSQEEKKAWLDYRANHGNPPRTVKALHAFMGRTE